MAYFPFFVQLCGKAGLVAGGGRVALRKIEKLLPYGPRLTVVAPEISEEIAAIEGLTLLRAPFSPELLAGATFAIAATNDRAENRRIGAQCRERRIPVNVVDDREACDFLFPALVEQGELSIGISTGGASPTAAVWIKRQIERMLPENFSGLLDYLDELRPVAKARLTDDARRARFFARLFARCMEEGWPLDAAALNEMLLRDAEEGEDGQ